MSTHLARALVFIGVLILFFYASKTMLYDIEYQVETDDTMLTVADDVSDTITASTTVLFVGDIMLGRSVESLIEKEGFSFPFMFASSTISAADIAVGNFEGVVPETHTQTPGMGFQFSIKETYLSKLRIIGFDVLSLANNHSLDYGESALTRTRGLCLSQELICVGSPRELNEYTTAVVTRDNVRIGFIAIETVFGYPDGEMLQAMATQLASSTDIQFAYVHWGNEYELSHAVAQETIAYALIDAGIDAVIGHHPHVVQDIALYKGKPIFYSLGNFIFDQYFSPEVQEHLAVQAHIEPHQVTYELNVFTSTSTPSQPQAATVAYRDTLLERVYTSTTTPLFISDQNWRFTIPRD